MRRVDNGRIFGPFRLVIHVLQLGKVWDSQLLEVMTTAYLPRLSTLSDKPEPGDTFGTPLVRIVQYSSERESQSSELPLQKCSPPIFLGGLLGI